jgi:hypothetical protein
VVFKFVFTVQNSLHILTLSLESNAIYLARSAENVKLDLYDKL